MSLPGGFWILALAQGLMAAGYAISFPFLAVYLNSHRGMPMSWVGAFLAGSMLLSSLARFLGGEISDAVGRRKVMVYSLWVRALVVSAIAWVIYARAPLWQIFVLHPLSGFIGSLFDPAAQSWVADYTHPAGRIKAYGFLRVGTNAGWAVGPALGGFLASGSYALMFVITAAVTAVCAAILALSVRDLPGAATGRAPEAGFYGAVRALSDGAFLRFCVFAFMTTAVMSQLVVSTSLYSRAYLGMGEGEIGLLFSINGLMVVFFQYFVTRLLEGRRLTAGLAAGAVCYAAGYLFFGYSPSFFFAAASFVVVTLGELAMSPAMQALGANMAPHGAKGRYLGVQGVFQQVGRAFGIFVGSNAVGSISPLFREGPWFIIAFLALTAGAGFLSLGRRLTLEQDGLKGPSPVPTFT